MSNLENSVRLCLASLRDKASLYHNIGSYGYNNTTDCSTYLGKAMAYDDCVTELENALDECVVSPTEEEMSIGY